VILENVKGLRETAQGYFEQEIRDQFARLDYSLGVWALCAMDYGVPQRRTRLFFVGRRRGDVPPPPRPVSGGPVTVRQAISDLPPLLPGASTDELAYRPGACSKYARSLRRGLERCTGHLVTDNNSLVIARYKHIPPGGIGVTFRES